MDLDDKKVHLEKLVEAKEQEAFAKGLAELFWLRKVPVDSKEEDVDRMHAAAANREKKLAEEWVVFLKEQLEEVKKEIAKTE